MCVPPGIRDDAIVRQAGCLLDVTTLLQLVSLYINFKWKPPLEVVSGVGVQCVQRCADYSHMATTLSIPHWCHTFVA